MVDSSNESLYHPEEEFDPNLQTGIPLQNNSEIVDVNYTKTSINLAANHLEMMLTDVPLVVSFRWQVVGY